MKGAFLTTPGSFKTSRINDLAISPVLLLRKKYKLSREALAYLIGVHVNAIYLWEKGKRKPSKAISMIMDMLDQGYAVPDYIRVKYRKKPAYLSDKRQMRRTPKYTTSLDLTAALLQHGRRNDVK